MKLLLLEHLQNGNSVRVFLSDVCGYRFVPAIIDGFTTKLLKNAPVK